MADGVHTADEYNIVELKLINSAGKDIDLSEIFRELVLYQDMFSSTMSGECLVIDGNDILNTFSLCGNEFLSIHIEKPGMDLTNPIKKTFRVYKITGRSPQGNSGQLYDIHFCSEEQVTSQQMVSSRSYKGKVSTLARLILTEDLGVPSKHIAIWNSTSEPQSIIVPRYRPLEAIQWLTSRSYQETRNNYCFFFFENFRGFNFVGLQSLYENTPIKDIKLDMKRAEPDPSVNEGSGDDMYIINDFDSLNSCTHGGTASRHMKLDLKNRKSYVQGQGYDDSPAVYSLVEAEKKKRLLNGYSQFNNIRNVNNNQEEGFLQSYESFPTFGMQSTSEWYREKYVIYRTLHLAALNSFKIRVVVPGDPRLNVGDIVTFDFKRFVAPDSAGQTSDQYRSGKYLITSLAHKFTDDTHKTILELSCDSWKEPLPAGTVDVKQITGRK